MGEEHPVGARVEVAVEIGVGIGKAIAYGVGVEGVLGDGVGSRLSVMFLVAVGVGV